MPTPFDQLAARLQLSPQLAALLMQRIQPQSEQEAVANADAAMVAQQDEEAAERERGAQRIASKFGYNPTVAAAWQRYAGASPQYRGIAFDQAQSVQDMNDAYDKQLAAQKAQYEAQSKGSKTYYAQTYPIATQDQFLAQVALAKLAATAPRKK